MTTVAALGLVFGDSPCSAQGPLQSLPPSPAAPHTVTGSIDDQPLTPAEERALLIEIRRSRGWDLEELARQDMLEEVLGKGRSRRLDEARFHFQLYAGEPHFADPLRDPELFDRKVEREVLGAYKKLARKSLEHALGVEEWLEGLRPERYRRSARQSRAVEAKNPWRARISPRFADDHVGVKFKMPHTGMRLFDHLSFRAQWELDEDRPTFELKYDDDIRYLNLDFEPGTEDRGDELRLNIRLLW
ncbi:MAG: hypothetical protein AAGE94_18430 [Acidobacteriota bacterium]